MVGLALLLAVGMQVDARAIQRAVYTNSQKLMNPYVLKAKTEKPKLKVELTLTPQIIVHQPWGGLPLVKARVHVTDPGSQLACPEITWDWGDETKSVHVEDCDPAALPTESWFNNKHYYRELGRFVVSVTFKVATMTRVESSSLEIR